MPTKNCYNFQAMMAHMFQTSKRKWTSKWNCLCWDKEEKTTKKKLNSLWKKEIKEN